MSNPQQRISVECPFCTNQNPDRPKDMWGYRACGARWFVMAQFKEHIIECLEARGLMQSV